MTHFQKKKKRSIITMIYLINLNHINKKNTKIAIDFTKNFYKLM